MKLIKYNRTNTGSNTTVVNNNTSSSGNDNASRGDGGGSLNRTIWGQNDTGDDVDGSMKINGNVSINCIVPPSYEPDDDDDGENEEEETGGGNLEVELNISSDSIETNNATINKHLYVKLPHAEHNGEKKCLVELVQNNADRITTNTTNITNLTTTVNSHTTQINNNATNISTNADEIAKLKDNYISEDRIKELINELMPNNTNGSYSNPVILFSGQLRRSTVNNSTYFVEGYKNPNISINVTNITDGLLTLEITHADATNNGYIYVGSANVTQAVSGDTADIATYVKGRSDGAHWFESRISVARNLTKIYIREFHIGNENNDTWYSSSWTADGGIKQVNITICGYYYAMPT